MNPSNPFVGHLFGLCFFVSVNNSRARLFFTTQTENCWCFLKDIKENRGIEIKTDMTHRSKEEEKIERKKTCI